MSSLQLQYLLFDAHYLILEALQLPFESDIFAFLVFGGGLLVVYCGAEVVELLICLGDDPCLYFFIRFVVESKSLIAQKHLLDLLL